MTFSGSIEIQETFFLAPLYRITYFIFFQYANYKLYIKLYFHDPLWVISVSLGNPL